MAPPPSSTAVPPVVALVVRLLTFICLLISAIVIATTSATSSAATTTGPIEVQMKFHDFYAYRYMLAAGVIGMLYTLVQIAFTIFYVSTGNRLGGDGLTLIDFYGDKIFSYMLATGAAAAFGLTVDLNRVPGNDSETENFLNKANAAASLHFIGFLFCATSSIFSSFSLPKST